jgi:hypothetical protein
MRNRRCAVFSFLADPARLRHVLVAAALGLAMLAGPGAAFPSPPANDNFADAGTISTLPFTDSGDLNGTTTEPGEPLSCSYQPQTVWYAFTPSSTTVISADSNGSQGGVILTAYQSNGGGIGGLAFMNCSFGGPLTFTANANTTYYFQVGTYLSGPVHMQLSVQQVPPPPNDDFVNAKAAFGLPFIESVDMTAATTEAGEPVTPAGQPIVGSAWYAFTATGAGSLTASTTLCCPQPPLAVYTGSSLTTLTEVKAVFGPTLTFLPTAGTTYYFQVGRVSAFSGVTSFRLDLTPPPAANFGFNPFDPSVFDTVQFFGFPFDPGGVGIASSVWDFGDTKTATGISAAHRYAADGDYTVAFTVTTLDGRTGSTSQVVQVRTHDVAITKLTVPNAASAGQTRQVSVGVGNHRYPETVQVQLLKSVPGSFNSFQTVGILTQFVPVASRSRTVAFDFSYTFTSDDAAVGKVTFEAIATILGGRDAQSADNTAIALPTKVSH